MKKTIKYAGLVAATLLATAPIATTTVSAATSTAVSVSTDANVLLHTILGSRTINGADLNDMNMVTSSKNVTWNQVKNTPLIKTLAGLRVFDADFSNTHMNFDYTVNGTPAQSTEVFRNYGRLKRDGGKIGVHITISDNANKLIDEATYTLNVNKGDVLTKTAAVNVNFNSINAKLNSDIEDTQFASTFTANGGEILDQNAASIANSGSILISSGVYKLNTSGTLSDPITTDKFTKNGTYYQYIEVTFDKTKVNLSALNVEDILINGKSAKTNNFLAGNSSTNTLVLVRTIKVGDDAANYTDTKASGVATVTNANRAQVFNYNATKHAMVPVAGKKFEKNSKWFTDVKRTITVDGSTYRRVSTNEWLKDSDTSFLAR